MKTIINLVSFVMSLAMLGGIALLLYKCYQHSKQGIDALIPELRFHAPARPEEMDQKAYSKQVMKDFFLWVLTILFYVLPSILFCLARKVFSKAGEKASDAIAYGVDKLDQANGLKATNPSDADTTPKGE